MVNRPEIRKRNTLQSEDDHDDILGKIDKRSKRQLEFLQTKGTSTRLTTLSSKDHDMYFNKEKFRDAIILRYNWPIKGLPRFCE